MKVINIFGGPGSGKSTLACDLFVYMKKAGYKVEYVDEYAKEKTYEREYGKLGDQLYILAKQHRKINKLHNQVDWVVTDSPLLLAGYYNQLNNAQKDSSGVRYNQRKFLATLKDITASYNMCDIFIERDESRPYQTFGRNQTFEEACMIDKELLSFIDKNSKHNPLLYDGQSTEELMDEILNFYYWKDK